jgi:PhnB protein
MPVTAYLSVPDANAAIALYEKAFGAVERFRLPGENGRVMHAELEIAGGQVFLSDMGPAPATPAGVGMAIGLAAAGDVDTMARSAAAAGITVTFGPEDMFWGDRFAELTDPFGHRWMLVAPQA